MKDFSGKSTMLDREVAKRLKAVIYQQLPNDLAESFISFKI